MFTRDQIEEIKKKLIMLGTKDTQFPDAHKLNGEEIIAIVQDGESKKIPLSSIINDDFINVSKDTTEILTLSTAVSKIDINNRKLGQIITFKDSANSWAIRQFTGSSLDNWNDISLWKSISGIDELKSQVETNAEDISVLSDEIERHDASITNLGNDVSKLKDKNIETSSSLSELTTRVNTLKSQADTNTSNISSLNTEVSTLQSKVDENTTSISQINNNIADHEESIVQINAKLDEHTESINAKITTDRIEDGAVTSEKIATSAFDDTLSVSGKIAPADVVGSKLTELEDRTSELEPKNIEEDGFYICDAKGNVLIRLDVLDTKGGVGESLANSIRSIIQGVGATGFDSLEAQEIGTELSKIINGFKDVKEVAEEGFYICDGDGEAIAKFVDDKWEFLGLVAGETIPRKGAETEKYARVTAGTYILGSFPKYLKMGRTVTLSTDVEQFGTIEIGVINTTKRTITIDSTNITLATDGTSRKTEAHGLTISGQLRVTFVADMLEVKAIIDCNGEQYIFKHTSDSYAYANHLDCSAYGNVGMIVGGSTILNNVVLSASSNYFGKDVWIFGDSYTSIDSSARWPNQVLFNLEYRNFMICGLSGGSSAQLYADLEKCLQYGTPKEIIWLLGMNNGDLTDAPNPSWLENLEKVEKICRDKGIELVLGTIPCTNQSTNDNSFKNEVIKSRGHRYINFAKAVGAEIKGSSWYEGMKEPDPGIHPSELGAKVLAAQILTDCPELTK